nr:fumarylacetoacetate hydrolase family protein [Nakamurella aerolata]
MLTYTYPDGRVAHGELVDEAAGTIEEWGDGDLLGTVTAGAAARNGAAGSSGDQQRATVALDQVRVLAPLQRPGKIICAATNYQEHIVEGGGTPVDKQRTSPKLFNKFDTAIAGTGETFVIPEISASADWEVELAVVIGADCDHVPVEQALDKVFGYATANDISLRKLDNIGFERDTENPWVGFFDWLEGKWANGSAPVGPYLVTADEVGDPQNLPISLTVNDKVWQSGNTKDMIFSCAELVAFASRLCTLHAGDIILTGTPSGVGATTSTWLADGDVMVAEVAGLGKLVTEVQKAR